MPRYRNIITLTAILTAAVAGNLAAPSAAHSGNAKHIHILKKPISGVHNNYWYDYQSDVSDAEIELRKDLADAKTQQDRREAWAEYNRELKDARKDYRKEMIEKGYIRKGRVTVAD